MQSKILRTGVAAIVALNFGNVKGQITIGLADYPTSVNQHRATERWVDNDAAYSLPTAGAAQVWDYQGIQYGLYSSFNYTSSSDPFWSDSHHMEQGLLRMSQFEIPSDLHFGLDVLGYYEYGMENKDTTYSLAAITGGPNDEVHFLNHKGYYTKEYNITRFPMTYGDTWTDTFSRYTHFEITAAAFGWNNAPGFHKRYKSTQTEVVGYGKLVMDDMNDAMSDSMDVLLVKTYEVNIDSFFVNGAPAPAPVLAALGQSQGQTTTGYEYFFYRKDYGDHILEFTAPSDAPGTAIATMLVNRDGVKMSTVGLNETAVEGLSVYPNPAQAGGLLYVDVPSEINGAEVRLMTLEGKTVATFSKKPLAQGTTSLTLPADLANGSYLLQVVNDGLIVQTQRMQILR